MALFDREAVFLYNQFVVQKNKRECLLPFPLPIPHQFRIAGRTYAHRHPDLFSLFTDRIFIKSKKGQTQHTIFGLLCFKDLEIFV